jgi:hypothetical protein
MRSRQGGHDTQDLALDHDGGGSGVAAWPERAQGLPEYPVVEHMALQKDDGVQSMPLGCGRDLATGC